MHKTLHGCDSCALVRRFDGGRLLLFLGPPLSSRCGFLTFALFKKARKHSLTTRDSLNSDSITVTRAIAVPPPFHRMLLHTGPVSTFFTKAPTAVNEQVCYCQRYGNTELISTRKVNERRFKLNQYLVAVHRLECLETGERSARIALTSSAVPGR